MKIRILIFGLTKVVGGVESYIRNLIFNIDREKYYFDFLIAGKKRRPVLRMDLMNFSMMGKSIFFAVPI